MQLEVLENQLEDWALVSPIQVVPVQVWAWCNQNLILDHCPCRPTMPHMAHPDLPLLHPLQLEEGVVEIRDSQHSPEHQGRLIPTRHQDNNLSWIYFSNRGLPLFFLFRLSMCTSSNLCKVSVILFFLDMHVAKAYLFCSFEAGWPWFIVWRNST